MHAALGRFKQEGRGVLVFLRDGAAGVPTHAIPQPGPTGSEAARSRQWREVGLGAQILKSSENRARCAGMAHDHCAFGALLQIAPNGLQEQSDHKQEHCAKEHAQERCNSHAHSPRWQEFGARRWLIALHEELRNHTAHRFCKA